MDRTPDPSRVTAWFAAALRLAYSPLLIAVLLWFFAVHSFSQAPIPRDRWASRVDHAGVTAYPVSDAGGDFQNALALLTGDG